LTFQSCSFKTYALTLASPEAINLYKYASDLKEKFRFQGSNDVFVIGAGLPRTGTNSMQKALQKLLDGKVYHMWEVVESLTRDIGFWNDLCKSPKSSEEWRNFYEANGYKGAVDFPSVVFYKEILEAFPNSKVILTVRDPATWVKSVNDTIKSGNDDGIKFPVNIIDNLAGFGPLNNMIQNICRRDRNRLHQDLFDVMDEGLEPSIKYYNDWVEEVKRIVPADRLLVFSVKEGWEPVCKFLGKPIPDEPFPFVNDGNMMKQFFWKKKIMAWTLVFATPIILGASSYFAKTMFFD